MFSPQILRKKKHSLKLKREVYLAVNVKKSNKKKFLNMHPYIFQIIQYYVLYF